VIDREKPFRTLCLKLRTRPRRWTFPRRQTGSVRDDSSSDLGCVHAAKVVNASRRGDEFVTATCASEIPSMSLHVLTTRLTPCRRPASSMSSARWSPQWLPQRRTRQAGRYCVSTCRSIDWQRPCALLYLRPIGDHSGGSRAHREVAAWTSAFNSPECSPLQSAERRVAHARDV